MGDAFSPDPPDEDNKPMHPAKPVCRNSCALVREFWSALAGAGCGALGGLGSGPAAAAGGTFAGIACYAGAHHALFNGMTEEW